MTSTRDNEQVHQVAAQWRDALRRAALAGVGTLERRRATADAARYEVSHGIAVALAPTGETFAASMLRHHREAIASATIVLVATRREVR